ncbi:hypothetical protein CW304_17005 [Bacillus sp. UFRGS-B20]|nr:hypothetical protein CW304_17005 [Bacillus sp. UFRGS-B20]
MTLVKTEHFLHINFRQRIHFPVVRKSVTSNTILLPSLFSIRFNSHFFKHWLNSIYANYKVSLLYSVFSLLPLVGNLLLIQRDKTQLYSSSSVRSAVKCGYVYQTAFGSR